MDLSNPQDEKQIIRLLRMRSTFQTWYCLIVDISDTHVTREIIREAKENAKAVRPLLKALAVVGSGSMVSAVSKVSGMNIATFESRRAAMDWLAKKLAKR
jgi:hypothetical protein